MKQVLILILLACVAGCAAPKSPAPGARQERLLQGLRVLRENPTFYINLEIAREAKQAQGD